MVWLLSPPRLLVRPVLWSPLGSPLAQAMVQQQKAWPQEVLLQKVLLQAVSPQKVWLQKFLRQKVLQAQALPMASPQTSVALTEFLQA